MPIRLRTLALVVLVATLGLTAAAFAFSPLRVLVDDPADGPPVRGIDTIRVTDSDFSPPVIEVPVGTTVTWEFADTDEGEPVAHNVTADGFRSPDTLAGRFKRTFSEPGSVRYRCDLHFAMRGRVVVVPG